MLPAFPARTRRPPSNLPMPGPQATLRACAGTLLALLALLATATPVAALPRQVAVPSALFAPPREGATPVEVGIRFDLHELNAIDDGAETFDFTGVLTTRWRDPRQAFDPAAEGTAEKVFTGDYQFNEVSPGWYPQVVLVNAVGEPGKPGVSLRVRADGTSTLVETIQGTAKVSLAMRTYPFDRHRLEAVFEVLGFGADEIRLVALDDAVAIDTDARLPQWTVDGASGEIRERGASSGGDSGRASAFVVAIDARREPFFVMRLIVFPLSFIVLLSFSVFWMDRSSLGDRINVSFIGILTGVAYQIVVGDKLPHISYMTVIHGFLTMSFVTMCATVVVNLRVGALDKAGRFEAGDRVDRRCRWVFPAVYFGLMAAIGTVAAVFFG